MLAEVGGGDGAGVRLLARDLMSAAAALSCGGAST